MKLVILYGPPAVGKLSVAQALAACTGFQVLHNHLFMNLSYALFDPGTDSSRVFSRQLRAFSLEVARNNKLTGVILTQVYARDRDTYILGLCDEAEAQGDEVCLVHLTCLRGRGARGPRHRPFAGRVRQTDDGRRAEGKAGAARRAVWTGGGARELEPPDRPSNA